VDADRGAQLPGLAPEEQILVGHLVDREIDLALDPRTHREDLVVPLDVLLELARVRAAGVEDHGPHPVPLGEAPRTVEPDAGLVALVAERLLPVDGRTGVELAVHLDLGVAVHEERAERQVERVRECIGTRSLRRQ
jgi:hypothetical protein